MMATLVRGPLEPPQNQLFVPFVHTALVAEVVWLSFEHKV